MLKWIVQILIGWPWCAHKWGVLDTIRVFEGQTATRPVSTRFVLQCQKCGDLKKREIG